MAKAQYIEVGAILTEGLQTRAAIDLEVVREYAEAERDRGAVLPPLVVFLDRGGQHWLADGFHRLAVARQNGRKKVACEVREGSRTDALRFALGANGAHGLRRTNADKAQAVRLAYEHRIELGLGEVPSARAVAEVCGVSDPFAGNQLLTVSSWREATERVGADGKVRTLPPVPTRKPTENGDSGGDGGVAKGAAGPPPPVRASRAGAHEEPHGGGVGREEGQGGGGTTDGKAGPRMGSAERISAPQGGGTLPPVPERRAGAVDGRGKPVPPHLAELWNRRGECAELARLVSRVRVALGQAQDAGDPLWAELSFSGTVSFLDRAYTEIAAAQPWCVCPMCQGMGCRACKGRGLMGKFRFKTVPRELR